MRGGAFIAAGVPGWQARGAPLGGRGIPGLEERLRVALIATGERGAEPAPAVAGRSLVLRQFDFARACGVERVIAYGDGELPDAAALRRETERAGIAHATIASAHSLMVMVDWGDELLVLQPGLLPEAEEAVVQLTASAKVLCFPSAAISRGRFERIDAARLWAGALVMPGALVDRIEQLREGADPHAALLRIALQARLPIEPLSPEVLTHGAWARVLRGDEVARIAAVRLRSQARSETGAPPSRRFAGKLLARFGERLSAARDAALASLLLAIILPCAGLFAAWLGQPALAFAAIALGVPVLEIAFELDRLARGPFRKPRFPHILRYAPDCAIVAAGILAIDGAWHSRLFTPVVLVAALNSIARGGYWRTLVGDRATGALMVAGAAMAGWQEHALMAWGLAALAAALIGRRAVSAPSEPETEQ